VNDWRVVAEVARFGEIRRIVRVNDAKISLSQHFALSHLATTHQLHPTPRQHEAESIAVRWQSMKLRHGSARDQPTRTA